jgi:hypothetical protein
LNEFIFSYGFLHLSYRPTFPLFYAYFYFILFKRNNKIQEKLNLIKKVKNNIKEKKNHKMITKINFLSFKIFSICVLF